MYCSDKNQLLQHFQKDPVLFAYHIGDLDDFFFPMCRWPVLNDSDGSIIEAILVYDHPKFPTVMAFGKTDKFPAFVEDILTELPKKFYCHYQKPTDDIFKAAFDIKSLGEHLKMELTDYEKHHDDDDKNIIALDCSHEKELEKFYADAYPDSYFDPRMLDTGKIIGYHIEGKLAAAAGLHIYSSAYKIAVLGNIATRPDFRGRGLATKLSSKLTGRLLDEQMTVCLNVKADNAPAIKCYRNIGFEVMYKYREAVFTERE